MVRLWHRVLFASASVLVSLAPACAGSPVYLALGDSGAFGETNVLPTNYGDQGYVRPFADYLGSAYYGGERPRVLNLGVPGETSGSALTGTPPPGWPWRSAAHNLNYTDPNQSQLSRMQEGIIAEKAAGNHVDYVSFALGGNDFQHLFLSPEFQNPASDRVGLLNQLLTSVRSNYDSMLTALRSEAPEAQLLLMNTYNPFLIAGPNDPVAQLTEFFSDGLDTVAREEAARYNGAYVDIHTPFVGHELEYTYIGTGNLHPTPLGYAVIANQMKRAARPPSAIPEPGTLALLAAAPLALFARRRR